MEQMRAYFGLVNRMADEAAEGLLPWLNHVDYLLGAICIGGMKNWLEAGLKGYANTPWRFGDWFSLQSADSRAALMRERHGTLFVDHERRLEQYLHGFWALEEEFRPYSLAFDTLRRRQPRLDSKGFHLPDVYDDAGGVRGIDRYRAALAHLAAHRLHTRPFIADNFSPFQQLFVEAFEDARVEHLAMLRYPGLRRLWSALHPLPREGDCPPEHSCIRHEMAMLSRALLDPDHPYTKPVLLDYVAEFRRRLTQDPYDTSIATDLGPRYLTKVHTPEFRLPRIYFRDTEIDYRDDNSYMWIFMEDTDDEDDFHSDHSVFNPQEDDEEGQTQVVRHLREWDYKELRHKPDWVTLYESLPPDGDPRAIDTLLDKHKLLAKRLKRIVDLLKPQQHTRIRYQEEGDELDLDVAIRSMVDYRSGVTPDPRIHMSHRTDGRDISVLLLLDLSQSINETPEGGEGTILQLSQEAVSLLAWAIDALGDPFAIAGFASNTRHEVRYLHFKGFSETWDDAPKARLAAMEGGLSTRMGAALRNAGHYLSRRQTSKKLLLVLTDGEPHDIDADDPNYLLVDTKQAVEELAGKGVGTYCITLDPTADAYVAEIFGANNFTVIDHVQKLPERLPQLFMALTR